MIGTKLVKSEEYFEVVDAYNTNFTRYYVICDKLGVMKLLTHEDLKNYRVLV